MKGYLLSRKVFVKFLCTKNIKMYVVFINMCHFGRPRLLMTWPRDFQHPKFLRVHTPHAHSMPLVASGVETQAVWSEARYHGFLWLLKMHVQNHLQDHTNVYLHEMMIYYYYIPLPPPFLWWHVISEDRMLWFFLSKIVKSIIKQEVLNLMLQCESKKNEFIIEMYWQNY